MYEAITDRLYSNLGHRLSNVGISSTEQFQYFSNFKYQKEITDGEQFIPMYACIPAAANTLMKPGTFYHSFADGTIGARLFPNVNTFLKNHPHWLTEFITNHFDSLTNYNYPSRLSRCVHNVNASYISGYNIATAISRGSGYGFKNFIYQLREVLRKFSNDYKVTYLHDLKSRFPYVDINKYALPSMLGTTAFRSPAIEGDLITATQKASFVKIRPTDERVSWVIRYSFLAKLGALPGARNSSIPIALSNTPNGMISDSDTYWNRDNLLCGLDTQFCVMVKAKERPLIWTKAVCGELNGLELEKGSVELWENKNLRSNLSKADLKRYNEIYHGPIRNNLGCPVRKFDNLTQTLFDLSDYTISFEDIRQKKIMAIERAKRLCSRETQQGGVQAYINAHTLF